MATEAVWQADSALVSRLEPSANHNERAGGAGPDMLVLHYTGMRDAASALARLRDPAAEVSAHYLVDEDGTLVQLVPEARRAWHAGLSRWKGRDDVNSRSIGIEIVNPGHEHGYRAFPSEQIATVVQLCRDCVDRWSIAGDQVVAHSDVAPARKEDPGEFFPWNQLWAAGVGHFVAPVEMRSGRFLLRGDAGPPVAAWQEMLASYGYPCDINGTFDDTTHFCTLAFQRHFRQAKVDGCADASTVATLHRLLATRP
ncbi:N-acetylmuramoyl-L-alanine amidase [Aureimonas sp. AU4]|uniref:N-acetylmuramoyl-L-alanine amidase n=1 Tax=Aureimonas sp. AU4 TaxID=1638163 RepID=UPI000784A691|nr:N-acetylmuramoyl-L-alanine amidase [Aureimonas sp. AU4]